MDHMSFVYWCILLTGIWGYALFWWAIWTKRPAKPSHAFKAVHNMMLGVILIVAINLYARHLRQAHGIVIADDWQFFWPLRWYPMEFALLYFCIHHTRKALGRTREP